MEAVLIKTVSKEGREIKKGEGSKEESLVQKGNRLFKTKIRRLIKNVSRR